MGRGAKLEEFQNKARRNFFPSKCHGTFFSFLTKSRTLASLLCSKVWLTLGISAENMKNWSG